MGDFMTDTAAPGPTQSGNAQFSDFKPAGTLTLSLKIALVAGVAAAGLELAFRVAEYLFLLKVEGGGFASGAEQATAAAASDARVEATALVRVGVYFVILILFLIWIHRANRNARALGAQNMRYTPGWSVGWFFVPFANLVMPYQVMQEIWRASSDPANWQSTSGGALVGWWWTLWVGGYFVAEFSSYMLSHMHDLATAKSGSLTAMAHDGVQIAAYVLVMLLVTRITARQDWQSRVAEVF
jgi:hypothetical protein